MSKVWWAIVLIVFALIIAFLIWPSVFGVPKSEAPGISPNQIFKGPTSAPYLKGPTGPPPQY